MGYSVKWVADNLGITRDMIRHYENANLIPKNQKGKYRDFNDEDIERLWGIKLLIEIGFSTKEIEALIMEVNIDFDVAIANKVKELEREVTKKTLYLEFAKTIMLTGRIPTVKEMGSLKINDFLAYARKNWNIYADSKIAPFVKAIESLATKDIDEWSLNDGENILTMLENIDIEEIKRTITVNTYLQLISDMQDFGFENVAVQRVVRLLLEYLIKHYMNLADDVQAVSILFAKHFASNFLYGNLAKVYENNYGKNGCLFIAKAIAFYAGSSIEDL